MYAVLVIIPLVVLGIGCAASSGSPKFPIHARPYVPMAVSEPENVFFKCGVFFCISPEHLGGLREYTIRMDSLVIKYENATEILNN